MLADNHDIPGLLKWPRTKISTSEMLDRCCQPAEVTQVTAKALW
jgi:hypothetical protein